MNNKQSAAEWFASWFDSPYYPILYQNRNDEEAEQFIQLLLAQLQLPVGAGALDLCCGSGRHSVQLHRAGLQVLGVDLSGNSIAKAKAYETDGLRFEVKDMRALNYDARFSLVVNLFTSFGYFDNPKEHEKTLQSVAQALMPQGVFVLDYLNPNWVKKTMVAQETKVFDGIRFNLRKSISPQNVVVKTIEVQDGEKNHTFEEKVRLFSPSDFETLLKNAGLKIYMIWGEYDGSEFRPESSSRQIIFARKEN